MADDTTIVLSEEDVTANREAALAALRAAKWWRWKADCCPGCTTADPPPGLGVIYTVWRLDFCAEDGKSWRDYLDADRAENGDDTDGH